MFLFMLLFCGVAVAQEALQAAENETPETKSVCYPDMCDLLTSVAVMKEKVGVLENRLKSSEKVIEELQSKGKRKVVFTASVETGGRFGPFNTYKTLVYNSVLTNIGRAYNQHTGIFTAPVAGVYYFTFFYHAGGASQSHLQLMKNSEFVALTSDHSTQYDGADNGGNAVFLQLQQRDQVYVRMTAHTHVWAGARMTSFSGFLLSES